MAPRQINADTNWLAIAAGDDQLLALKSDGTLWWQVISFPPPETLRCISRAKWKEIYSGPDIFFIRRQNGSWSVWGKALYRADSVLPQQFPFDFDPWAFAAGYPTRLLLTKDGGLWTWGQRTGSKPVAGRGRIGDFFTLVARHYPGLGKFFKPAWDKTPYRLWELPPEVRRSLGNPPQNATN